jgi:hypothetical protein
MIIDFSAYDQWNFCPAAWWEKYVGKRRRKWPKALRNDALCLGSLVHEGLRVWQVERRVEIPPQVVEEVTPDRDTYQLALELVHGYATHYPEEQWELLRCEEPLTFGITSPNWHASCSECFWISAKDQWEKYPDLCPSCGSRVHHYSVDEGLTGLAKLDTYFYVRELTRIDTGDELGAWLTPGWWVQEHKTKGVSIPLGLYMQSWESGMQASFQMMALRQHLRTQSILPFNEGVQGVLVNVLEKPRRYIPKRTCQGCKEKVEFYTWLPTGEGTYACPLCGHRQELTPLRESTPPSPPHYYRIVVSRSEEQLARDLHQITQVGEEMVKMAQGGLHSHPWTKKNCVNFQWRRACDYYSPHLAGESSEGNDEYETMPDYRGLVTLEGEV